ncbi:hypothetical protein QBC34DRAFT_487857 [Podospora aff. communis PSN243]|uniref:Ecp2 effector protein domain-containing protein n=1 Tax=Podospora aff. communis PSN243 TaxID=3040156 RepID=A0AAV9GAA3_9PEZI|nr:hypothetical protein QBC34DRAFT_487857 [Podospora aff. communis PSN243]
MISSKNSAVHLFFAMLSALFPLSASQNCNEGTRLVCYGQSGGTSQDVDVEEVAYVAEQLRAMSEDGPAFWTMPANPTLDECDEWTLYEPFGTVWVLAKHTSNRVNSSVSYDEMANTIDGGVDATEEQRKNSILGCGTGGGQLVVQINASNPVYKTEAYKTTTGVPRDILIKVVSSKLQGKF